MSHSIPDKTHILLRNSVYRKMRDKYGKVPGLVRMRMAAMRAIRVGFCVLRRPVVVVCVHLPAVALVIHVAAILVPALFQK